MKAFVPIFLLVVAPALAICLALLGLETLRDNVLGWVLFSLGAAYTGGILIDFHANQQRYRSIQPLGRRGVEERSDLSFWLILPGFLTVFFASPLEWMYLGPTLPRTPALQAIGGVLFLSGVMLLVWARRSLRGSCTPHLAVREGQPLVESGPYRVVRHPAYGGELLMAMGVALGYSSTIGVAALLLLLIPGLVYRIRVEERLLTAQFGEAYAAYARRTRRILPGVW